jgi:hypothetical protein
VGTKSIITSPKWRNTAQQDIENDPCTPYINFRSIVPLEHLWSHVIRTSNNFREPLTY